MFSFFYFLFGTIFGYTYRAYVRKKPEKAQGIYFLCNIKNETDFNVLFPTLNCKNKVQPHWQYYPNKRVIKIKIDDYVYENGMTFDDFMYTTSIDHKFFELFGENYIYVHYGKKIKMFKSTEFLTIFDKKENPFVRKITCSAKGKKMDLTNYYQKFVNQYITPKLLLLNYNQIDVPLEDIVFKVDSKEIKLNEYI
jgi:hypothetical protein